MGGGGSHAIRTHSVRQKMEDGVLKLDIFLECHKFMVPNATTVSLFLLQLWFTCNLAFYFNMGNKLWRHTTFYSTCLCYYRKHPNNDNKICPLPYSACFQQHFHDWLSVLYNLDDHHYYLAPNKSVISQIDPIPSQFITIPAAEYAPFSHPTRTVKTELSQFIINFF